MKKGDRVTAFDPKKGVALTHGKEYNVRGIRRNKIKVFNDEGKVLEYARKNFLCCQEEESDEETKEQEPETEREKDDNQRTRQADRWYDEKHGK
jgi:hypothetical protein